MAVITTVNHTERTVWVALTRPGADVECGCVEPGTTRQWTAGAYAPGQRVEVFGVVKEAHGSREHPMGLANPDRVQVIGEHPHFTLVQLADGSYQWGYYEARRTT